MNTKEIQALNRLSLAIANWLDEITVGYTNASPDFRHAVTIVKHMASIVRLYAPVVVPLTVEEKLQDAVFYINSDGIRYTIDYVCDDFDSKYFCVSDLSGNEFHIDFDSVPADSHFLRCVRM